MVQSFLLSETQSYQYFQDTTLEIQMIFKINRFTMQRSVFTTAIVLFFLCGVSQADDKEVERLCKSGHWEVFNTKRLSKGFLPGNPKLIEDDKARKVRVNEMKESFAKEAEELYYKIDEGKFHQAINCVEQMVDYAIQHYIYKTAMHPDKFGGDKDDWRKLRPEDKRVICWQGMHATDTNKGGWQECWKSMGSKSKNPKNALKAKRLHSDSDKTPMTLIRLLVELTDGADDDTNKAHSRLRTATMCAMITKNCLAIIEGHSGDSGKATEGVGVGAKFYKGGSKGAGLNPKKDKAWRKTAAKFFGVYGGHSASLNSAKDTKTVVQYADGWFGLDPNSLTRAKWYCGWLWPLLVVLCGCCNCCCLICHLARETGDDDDETDFY